MNRRNNFLGLPNWGLNGFLGGLTCFVSFLGLKALFGSDILVQSGAHTLMVGNSAGKLEAIAEQLERQAALIEQKDQAYSELQAIYERSLKGQNGYGKLQQAIEAVEELPQVDNIESIKQSIEAEQQDLIKAGGG